MTFVWWNSGIQSAVQSLALWEYIGYLASKGAGMPGARGMLQDWAGWVPPY